MVPAEARSKGQNNQVNDQGRGLSVPSQVLLILVGKEIQLLTVCDGRQLTTPD